MPLELPTDYFALFGLARAMEVDTARMRAQYHALQRRVHPDRYVGRGARERALAAQAAAHVSQAYRTLSDPYLRAAYLLQLHGIDPDPEQETTQDTEFLMQQMEWRERLEEMGTDADARGLAKRLEEEERALWRDFDAGFDAQDWERSRTVLHRLQFYRRLREQLAAARARMEH